MNGRLKGIMKGKTAVPFNFTISYLFGNLSKTGRTKKQIFSFAIDGLLVAFCIWAAFSLRLGTPYNDFQNIGYLMVVLPPVTVLIFAGLGVYRWVVRASSTREFEQLLKGSIGSSSVLLGLLYIFPITFAPRSVFFIYGVLLILTSIGARIVWAKIQNSEVERNGKPVAIYGAGAAGRQLVSLMRLSTEYHPEFFIDDGFSLANTTVAGLQVMGPNDARVQQLLKKHAVEEIVLAMPSIKSDEYTKLLSRIEGYAIPITTIPSITDIVSGRSSPDEIREIRLEDLLGRDPVEPDSELLTKNITGKKVLVTGAGGSIGSELCRQIKSLNPDCLIMLDNSEPALYAIDQEINGSLDNGSGNSCRIFSCLGSVTDAKRIEHLFAEFKPDTIYHAAAYKHVPLVEHNPFEGVKTNVLGTRNLIRAAEKSGVSTFVMISTDKAVRPTNVMGATKRVAEQVVQGRANLKDQSMVLCMVRFGNVLGSSGSVIPKFKKQIANGGPITVTHPEMTRYFMLIPEAVSLVIQAGSMAKGGEVFLLEMGEPVKILDLAKTMVRLHGMSVKGEGGENPKKNIEIVFTGIRPGEKLYEELLIDEVSEKTKHPKIRCANENFVNSEDFESDFMAQISDAINNKDEIRLKAIFGEIVSGYRTEAISSDTTS